MFDLKHPQRMITHPCRISHLISRELLAYLGSLFWFCSPQLHCFSSVSLLSSTSLPTAAGCFFSAKNCTPRPSSKQQVCKVSDELVSATERLAAEEPDVFSGDGGDQNQTTRRGYISLTFVRSPETNLQMNAYVALCLLGVEINSTVVLLIR